MLLVSFVGVPTAMAQPNGRARGHYKHAEKREAREEYWDASKHYRRDERRYRARRLGRNDRVYRGSDNRYYCKRDDGTSGLIIGGLAGGVLGNVIAPGGSKTIGTIAGAGLGAIIGKTIDDGEIVCR
jgi:tetrahydromethanopterin S-methyltransferase subunit F